MKWLLLFLLAACGGNTHQSALSSAGPGAYAIEKLFWILTIGLGAVFILTLALLARALKSGGNAKKPGGKFILGFGVFMPAMVVTAILFYSLSLSFSLKGSEQAQKAEFRIVVTGHQWWWEVEYPEFGIMTANELHIPKGKNVAIELRSADVIHSFWVPSLHGKLDAIPDHPNTIVVRADRTGVFRGQCAEYCGLQHALMGLYVVSLEEEEFDRWVEQKSRPWKVKKEEFAQM
ncbi:MAG: cytochrome c oxidase subunit II, partial [Bacteriovoracaceae bacterium]